MQTAGSLDGLLRCSEHNCPMLRIGNQYECVIERVDAHLGGKRVKDILPDSQRTPFALIFEDGHTLPLLYPDCGRSLHISHENEDLVLNEFIGLYLVGLAYVEPEEERPGLALVFSRDPDANLENPATSMQEMVLHLDSARRLTCPDKRIRITRRAKNTYPRKRSSRKIQR